MLVQQLSRLTPGPIADPFERFLKNLATILPEELAGVLCLTPLDATAQLLEVIRRPEIQYAGLTLCRSRLIMSTKAD